MSKYLILVLFALCGVALGKVRQNARTSRSLNILKSSLEPVSSRDDQRNAMIEAGYIVALAGGFVVSRKRADATVFFDGDAYGDKELKVATLNKVKQMLRNSVNKNPNLALDYFRIAVSDALGYDVSTFDGGLDGSIIFENPPLQFKDTIATLKSVQSDLQDTNAVSFADITAFAGAEAMETMGSPRITVQLGRVDAKKANEKPPTFNVWGDSSEAPVAKAKSLFTSSGLSARDIAALVGAHGEIDRILQQRQANINADKKEKAADDDSSSEFDSDEGDEMDFVPISFGRRDMIYGEKLANSFGNSYIRNLLSAVKKSAQSEIRLSLLDRLLIEDEEVKGAAKSLASSDKAFEEAVVAAYNSLAVLGQAYSRSKD